MKKLFSHGKKKLKCQFDYQRITLRAKIIDCAGTVLQECKYGPCLCLKDGNFLKHSCTLLSFQNDVSSVIFFFYLDRGKLYPQSTGMKGSANFCGLYAKNELFNCPWGCDCALGPQECGFCNFNLVWSHLCSEPWSTSQSCATLLSFHHSMMIFENDGWGRVL